MALVILLVDVTHSSPNEGQRSFAIGEINIDEVKYFEELLQISMVWCTWGHTNRTV